MTFTDVDFSADLAQARRFFRPDYQRDGSLSVDEYRAVAESHWPDWRRPSDWPEDLSDFA
jgi:hypothetical protein